MTAHDAVWQAYLAEPKPVTAERARELGIAATQAAGARPDQFADWFDANSVVLMAKINGTSSATTAG